MLAANVHGNCPRRPDGAFQKEHGGGQTKHGGVGTLGQRGRHDENRATQHAHDRHHPPGELEVAGLGQQPVGNQAANRIADHAGPKRQ